MAKLIYGWSCLGAERMRALAQMILRSSAMCRNIRPLFNFEPPATGNEMHDAALQFVRKISGYTHPSQSNQAAFEEAVEDIEKVVKKLLA